jgi:hypothetical protein
MREENRADFVKLLTGVMSYYGKDVSGFMLNIYWQGLEKYDYEDVSRGFSLHAANPDNGQFPPKISDITKMLEGSTETQGMRAWSKVKAAIASVGKMQSVVFDDPIIHTVIHEMGGWYALCNCLDAELPFRARDFEKRYQGYRVRRETPEFPPMLIGGHEADNRLNGFPNRTKPVLIGDVEQAKRVLSLGSDRPVVRITDARSAAAQAARRLTSRDDDDLPPRAA